MRDENFLIIAHYHSRGLIRNDLLTLLKEQQKKFLNKKL
tara:strand:+ start:155 stop:271 length:117 start_codon:yes stop_codon:yes gene_type:complete